MKAYFDGSSSYLGSEVNLHTTSQVSTYTTTRHLNRPKSSPAKAIAERNAKVLVIMVGVGLEGQGGSCPSQD